MFNFIRILFIWLLLPGAVAAQPDDRAPKAEIDALWQAIDATDYAALEAQLSKAQQRYIDGEVNAEHMRALMTIFYANNPDLVSFTEQWRKRFPKSPFAMIAEAWLYYRISWDIRGKGRAREIYPEALRVFREMQVQAWFMATKAYEIDRRFIPASDAVLRIANPVGGYELAYDVLDEVMESDPNMGTLTRGLGLTHPGWAGSARTWKKAKALCSHYGPMINWTQGDPVTHCEIDASGSSHYSDDRLEWFKKTLLSGEYPDLEYYLLHWATHYTANRVEAEFAREYLNRDDVTEVDFARAYDANIAPHYGFEFVSYEHQLRAWNHARAALERDPYNPDLIKTLQRGVDKKTQTETGSRRTKVKRISPEEKVEFARRLLVASPYWSKHWLSYGRALHPRTPESLFDDEPFRINAVYFDNHSAGSLSGYANDKVQLLSNLQKLESDLKTERFKAATAEEQAQAKAQIAKWIAKRESMDLDREIKCPMMRAYRLYLHVCETEKGHKCEASSMFQQMIEIVRADVNERQVCTGVMAAPIRDLFFERQDINLSAPEG